MPKQIAEKCIHITNVCMQPYSKFTLYLKLTKMQITTAYMKKMQSFVSMVNGTSHSSKIYFSC